MGSQDFPNFKNFPSLRSETNFIQKSKIYPNFPINQIKKEKKDDNIKKEEKLKKKPQWR